MESVCDLFGDGRVFESLWCAGAPPRCVLPPDVRLPAGQTALDLVTWGVAVEVGAADCRFFTNLFAVPKAGKPVSRLIVDASRLNRLQMRPPKFVLPRLEDMRVAIMGSAACVKLDLRHAFYQYPLHPSVSSCFCFRSGGRCFRFARLPMGWSFAPFICQAFACAVLEAVGRDTFLPLLDDWLLLGQAAGQALAGRARVMAVLDRVGASINAGKSDVREVTRTTYNGIEWDLVLKAHRLSADFVAKWSAWLDEVSALAAPAPVRLWVAALSAALYVVRVRFLASGRFFALFRFASYLGKRVESGALDWTSMVEPGAGVLMDLAVVAGLVRLNDWVLYFPLRRSPWVLWTDAAPGKWCFVLARAEDPLVPVVVRHGHFRYSSHINTLEVFAVYKGLRYLAALSPASLLWVLCDNTSAVAHVNRLRGSSPAENGWVVRIADVLETSGCRAVLSWVPSADQLADDWTR